jgi:hypothetical protein
MRTHIYRTPMCNDGTVKLHASIWYSTTLSIWIKPLSAMTTKFMVTFLIKCTNILHLNLNQKGCRSDAYFWYVDLYILTQNIFLTLDSYWPMLFRLYSLIHSSIHSFILLSIASSKASSPQSGIGCSSFHYQYPLFSLRSSSCRLRLFHRFPVTYVSRSIFPSIRYSRRQFLRTMWPIQLTSLHFIVYSIFLSCLTVCNTY